MFHANVTFRRNEFHLSAELSLNSGSITALIGASGSGKSSLFRVLCGLEQPLSGQIYSEDVCWYDGEAGKNLALQKRKVGMVFQDYALFEHLTVFENIAYGVDSTIQDVVVGDWLNRINLTHKAGAFPQDLSGGEKQRVALARALAIAPDLLLLDEPFSALDVTIRHDLRRGMQTLIADTQIPVLIATHDLVEARFLADFIYVLSEGKIIRHGTVSDVFQNPKTISAARALGWQNILPVDDTGQFGVKGPWGTLVIGKENFVGKVNINAIGIPIDAIAHMEPIEVGLASSKLDVVLTHCADMGGYYLVDAKLLDNTCISFHIVSSQKPIPDQKLVIFIDLSRIVPLSK